MGLQDAFDQLLQNPGSLAGLDGLIWQGLSAGSRSSDHPWNLGAISTLAPGEGSPPASRIVVLRGADADSRTIDCHTDRRSQKFDHVTAWPDASPVSWLFYESSTKVQLRLTGTASTIESGDEWEAAWTSTSLRSRSAYVSIATPGSEVDSETPPDVSDRDVDSLESERGRAHFVIVRTQIQSIDWLYLRREGHIRASLRYDELGAVQATWLVP